MAQPESPGSASLQFETAEYADKQGIEYCSQCRQQIINSYFRVNGHKTCPACVELAKANQLKSDGNFAKALVYGIGAAIAGLIIYSAFEIATGWVIGYLSLAVGWMIGKAMMKGSAGIGGRKLQIAAVILTYSAVSLAAVPVAIHYYSKERTGKSQTQTQSQTQDQTGSESQGAEKQSAPSGESGGGSAGGLLSAFGTLLMIGLASPFLELSSGVSGIIGLVILFVGLNIAWKTTKGTELVILGPFNLEKPD
jgi:hypothetical protein